MRENLLKNQPTWGLRRAQGTGQKSATPATLTKVILILLTMLLLPSTAWGENYPITVAGIQVTDENAANVLNDDETATVSFTPASGDNPATLTLNNATIDMSEIPGFCPIESSIANLTIQLIGYNTLTPNSDNINGIRFTDGTTTGNLTFTTSNVVERYVTLNVDGIYQFSDLTSGYNVTNSFTTEEQTGWSKIESGFSGGTYNYVRIDYTEYYDVWVGGARLSSSSLSPVSGGTKYIPSMHTLHLAGYGYSDEIKSGLQEFIVEVSGSNNSVSNITFEGNTPGTIIFKKDESSPTGNNMVEFTGSVKGFSSVTITPPLQLVSPSGIDDPTSDQWNSFTNVKIADFATTYNIAVGGKNVTNANASNILGDGTVSYDSENNILTLNDATIIPESKEYGITYTGTTDLVISLNGTSNVVKGVGGCPAIGYFNNDVQTAPSLTFTNGSETDPCKLQLESVGTATIGGFGSVVNTGLYKIDETILGADQENIYHTTITSTLLSGGSGTSAHPFIVGTADDLKNFAKYVNDGILSTEYIKLGGNIDCTNLTGFEPIGNTIGNNTKSFIGTFNGDGNSITGLTFSNTNPDGVSGLFGEIGSIDTNNDAITRGTVKNLTLNGCQFGNGGQNGAIAGYLHYGTIENCTVTSCTISSGNSQSTYSGGITGMVYNGIVKDCTVNGGTITSSITNSGDGYVYAGGIVAYAYSDSNINGCTVTDVSINSTGNGQNSYSGGIVGYSEATISGNSVKGSTTVNSINNENNETLVGAIVANKTGGLLTENYYDFTVKTKTTIGNNDPVEKSGYTQRAVGGILNEQTLQYEDAPDITENNGAVMYTKPLTVGVASECNYYEPLSSEGILALAPGETVDISLSPADGIIISNVSLVYTPTGGTEQAVALENFGNPDGYNYSFEMPDAEATLNITYLQLYNLWIGETQVTSDNAANVLGDDNGSVSFSATVGVDTAPTYTLTLNGATLTAPVKVGLPNLTIDIQGTNSIITDETCIQKLDGTTPAVTFKSTSDVVGSLTLKSAAGVNNIGVDGGSFSISDELALVLKKDGYIYSNQYWFTDGSTKEAKLSPSYGVTVGAMQICPDNAADVIGDGIGDGDDSGMVSFDKDNSILTLTNASLSGIIRSSLPYLTIELVGDNSIYSGRDRILQAGVAVNMTIQSSAAVKGTLSMHKGYSSSEKGNFVDDNVTLTISAPLAVLSGSLEDNSESNDYYATIGVSYGLTVAGVTVTSANASNVLGGATATVVFTPADNTASPATPATLTLNGADNLGTILSGLENLKVIINGENAAAGVSANSAVSGDKNITFEGGTNGGILAISAGDGGSVVSGFASVSYDGAYAAADIPFGYDKTASQQGYRKSHMMDDNSYLETLTITTVPHYPIWLYTNVTTSTQINNTNKNTLLGASGNVSFDGNTLSLKNGVNCNARIVSGLSNLTISIDGDCIIESPDSGSVVRSINSSAPLTIEKANGASSATLKLAAVSYTAIKAFASLDYTGLILLSDGATYTSGALKDSKGEPLNVAIFTSSLNPGLQFVQGSNPVEGEVDYTIGGSSNPTLPTLQKPEGVTVTYTSSATGVATVAADGTVTPVGIGSTTITATSEQTAEYTAGEASYTLNVYKSLSHSSITVEISDVTYNGKAQTPIVTVKDGDDVLPYGEDNGGGTMLYAYKLEFANNTNAASATAETNAPTATITALTDIGESNMEVNWYRGSTTKTFTISPMSISTATVCVDSEQTYTYTGSAIEPNVSSVSIYLKENAETVTTLTAGTDYTVTGYVNNINAATTTSENAPTVTITGKGNFTGTASGKFTIEQADLSDYVVTGLTTPTAYTGSPITPEFSVKATETAETSLTANTDYSVKYQQAGADVDEMKDAGAYKILISGQGNYKGSLDADFTIDRATLNLTINLEGWTYGDTPNVPSLDGNLDEGDITWEYKATGADTYSAWSTLTTTTDAGTYMVRATVAETDNYAGGSKEAEFVIEQLDISQADITLDNTVLTYNGEQQTVNVTKVMAGDIEVPVDCYEVSGNTEKEAGDYKLTVTAKTMDSSGNPIKNNFTGSAEKAWKININHRTASAEELGFKSETQTASTYYNSDEDFNLPEGYVAYIITGINGNSVTTQRVSYIPNGVAVLVEKGQSSESPNDATPYPSTLPLKGTQEPVDVTSITGGTVYVLYNGEFVKSTSGTIPAHRCYLLVATNVASGTRSFGIDHGDGTTSLREVRSEGVKGEKLADGEWYTLQGRKFTTKPTKPGLYILNGKKVVIK